MSEVDDMDMEDMDFKSLTSRPFIHNYKQFFWSQEVYEPKQIPDSFGHQLPLLAMATESYYGENEIVESEEMYWVRQVAHQPRVVVKDENENYFSFPMNYPHSVFPVKWSGEPDREMSIADMVRSGMSFKYLRFSRDVRHLITKHGGSPSSQKFGRLEFVDMYQEKFLVAYAVLISEDCNPIDTYRRTHVPLKDGIYPVPNLIPVCMPVQFVLGLGYCDGNTELFYWAIRRFKMFTDKLSQSYDDKLQEVSYVMAYDSRPSDGDYEYIHDLHFSTGRKGRSFNRESNIEGPYVELSVPDTNVTWPVGKHLDTIHTVEKICEILDMTQQEFDSKYKVDFEKLKPKPKKEFPKKAMPGPPVPSRSMKPVSKKIVPQPPTEQTLALPPKLPIIKPLDGQQKTHHPKTPSKQVPLTSNKPQTHARSQQLNPVTTPSRVAAESSTHLDKNSQRPRKSKIPFNARDVSEIPVDISSFSVNDVCRCLELLNLQQYVDNFRTQMVDGQLLKGLDKNVFIEDFNFATLDARRLHMFVHEGWRPKLQ